MEFQNINANHSATDIDLALCRAALYSTLAIGFQAPTDDNIARLLTGDNRVSLAGAAALLDPASEHDLVSLITAVPHAEQIPMETLTSQYRALFGHTARGPVPPYETEYGSEALFQQPQELGDLMGFYHAFGLTLKHGKHERPDHISCECEFLMFLALKEAYALEHNDGEMLAETRKAQKLFLRDHLGRFLPTFATKLLREDRGGFYGTLAELCLKFVTLDAEQRHVALGAMNLGLRPGNDDRVPMACGSGTECAAMPGASVPEGADSV